MGHVAFLLAFIALPILSFYFVRSVTWVVIYLLGGVSLAGLIIGFLIDHGRYWTFTKMQFALLATLLAVTVVAFLSRRQGRVPLRRQLWTMLVPAVVILVFFLVSRAVAQPTSGGLAAVGYFVDHPSSEDNAKWLDFAGFLADGGPITQQVPMGGPLQLVVVFMATLMAVVSIVVLGGVNEVFVAANSIMYGQMLLVVLIPFALAPLAEAKVRIRHSARDTARRVYIPAPAVWLGILALGAGSTALINLGHFTVQFVFLIAALWLAVFMVGTRVKHAAIITSMSMAIAATVWFPLAPVSVVILVAYGAWFVRRAVRARSIRVLDPLGVAMWAIVAVLMSDPVRGSLRYMTDQPTASGAALDGGGLMRTGVRIPALELLTSQGGTEATAPLLALLTAASALLAGLFVARRRFAGGVPGFARGLELVRPFAPALLLIAYSLGLSLLGTWWAGTGPGYGAVKMTFLASVTVLAVTLPLAIMEIDAKRSGLTLARVVAVVAVIYLLTIDTLLPRAFSIVSPTRWPVNVGADKGYWWPAEVRPVADQTIAENPIGCVYFPQGAPAPTALPNGGTTYNCTRILSGLSGMDWEAQPLVDWLRREWLNNEAAWTNEWPNLVQMPYEVLEKQLILLDEDDNVVGLESVRSLLDRYRPQWAEGQTIGLIQP